MGVTHLEGLSITPLERGGTAFEITTGTVTLNKANITGTTLISGRFTVTGGKNFRIGSAANAVVGLKAIAAGSVGSGIVATTKAQSSSRVLTTSIGVGNLSAYYRTVMANVASIASGTNFKIRLYRTQTAGTVATASGRVAWQIINL